MTDDVENDCWDEDPKNETEQLSLNGHGDSKSVSNILHRDIFQCELCYINRTLVFKVACLKLNYFIKL